jgi:AraC-like DNA-binding protein
MDVLTNIISAMRLSGSVFLEAEFTSPWCVTAMIPREDWSAFFPEAAHIIAYHYVAEGEFLCALEDQPPVTVRQGQILLLTSNDKHVKGSSLAREGVSARSLMQPQQDGGLARIFHGGGGDRSKILCGFFGSVAPTNELLRGLPRLMVIDSTSGAAAEWLANSMRFASREAMVRSPALVAQLAELLLAEAVRQYVAALPEGQSGWLAGLSDPHVRKTLGLLHSRYSEAWTMERLAREAGLSRSALADRFATHLGEPPIRYLSRHRMKVAADLLDAGSGPICSVGYCVGFTSEAAFSRAFKKEFGLPPGAWRKRGKTDATSPWSSR